MIFFYELIFVLVALGAVLVGEVWSRLAAVGVLALGLALAFIGVASFDARLATPDGLNDDDRRWFVDTRDGLKHLRLLFAVGAAAAVVWRLLAG